MLKSRISESRITTATLLIPLFTLLLNLSGDAIASGARGFLVQDAEPVESSEITTTVSAPYTTSSWDERDATRDKFELPLLYLHQQHEPTPNFERTLEISVAGLPGGTELKIEAISHHVNVVTGERHTVTKSFQTPDRPCIADAPCTLQWTLDAATTPSDLYYLRLTDQVGKTLWQHPDRPAFVALDTWEVGLGVYSARIYYATLFPFAKGPQDVDNRLSPARVTEFIEHQFAPAIQETWQIQVEEWGFGPLQPDWDTDKVIEVFVTAPPFALFNGTGIYTVDGGTHDHPYRQRRIWWLSSATAFQRYDALVNGYKAVFAHEFFHMMQWNVLLSAGAADGRLSDQWLNAFVEAQAALAASVQYPELELQEGHVVTRHSAYGTYADHFLTKRLNESYRDINGDARDKYDVALYWRFLYEQYNGMAIIRAALEEMVRHYDADILLGMESAMDTAFARVDGPFRSYEESLIAFARANYALRLENGRCADDDSAACAGLHYDPEQIYTDPPLEAQLIFDGVQLRNNDPCGDYGAYYGLDMAATAQIAEQTPGATLTYSNTIPASYGMDFIEIRLDPGIQGQPLTISFQAESAASRFNVQVWKLAPGGIKPRAKTFQPNTLDGSATYPISATIDRLALIITRLDADETLDPIGGYHITVETMQEL